MNGQAFRLLERKQAEQIVRGLAHAPFVDGRVTAPGLGLTIKHNLQVERTGEERSAIDETVVAAIGRHQQLHNYAMPVRFTTPMYSRYEPGMQYGDHVDNSLMGKGNGVRTDLAMTLFLSPPASYEGGELTLETGEQIKLDSGEAFVYPATSIHRVAPVSQGVRLAAIIWMQSAVRDERIRAVLHDLSIAVQQAEELKHTELALRLTKSYHNLVRYAANPS
jgi:PKHD-type hydroxylase